MGEPPESEAPVDDPAPMGDVPVEAAEPTDVVESTSGESNGNGPSGEGAGLVSVDGGKAGGCSVSRTAQRGRLLSPWMLLGLPLLARRRGRRRR